MTNYPIRHRRRRTSYVHRIDALNVVLGVVVALLATALTTALLALWLAVQ